MGPRARLSIAVPYLSRDQTVRWGRSASPGHGCQWRLAWAAWLFKGSGQRQPSRQVQPSPLHWNAVRETTLPGRYMVRQHGKDSRRRHVLSFSQCRVWVGVYLSTCFQRLAGTNFKGATHYGIDRMIVYGMVVKYTKVPAMGVYLPPGNEAKARGHK